MAKSTVVVPRYYDLDYTVALKPQRDEAWVKVHLPKAKLVKQITFRIDPERHSNISADGELRIEKTRAIWTPGKGKATFSLRVALSSKRKNGKYDARMTSDWAIFRGDDLIPAAKVRAVKGAESKARLRFDLPSDWSNVDTGWLRDANGVFIIDNPKRRFDRPTGWMIAGRVGSRRDQLGSTEFSVAAPRGSALKRMDILSFVNMVWPYAERAFGDTPPKILIVGAGDPMWRGGLSAPNSLYMHADRPIVSENATSSLIHELTHVITGIRGAKNADWIAEGLAEYYSIELVRRAGGIGPARYRKIQEWLKNWSKKVKRLTVARSSGPVTARAVLLLQDLDAEIRSCSKDKHSLDDVTQALRGKGRISTEQFRTTAGEFCKGSLKTLDTRLLRAKN